MSIARTPPPYPQGTPLMSGPGPERVVRFTLNGQVKSLNKPVSGRELYRLAGGAQTIKVGEQVIADNGDALDLAEDVAVTAEY